MGERIKGEKAAEFVERAVAEEHISEAHQPWEQTLPMGAEEEESKSLAYGGAFRRSRHRSKLADGVVEGFNAVPAVDLLQTAPAQEVPVAAEISTPLDIEERAGLKQYLQLGGAAVAPAAELRFA